MFFEVTMFRRVRRSEIIAAYALLRIVRGVYQIVWTMLFQALFVDAHHLLSFGNLGIRRIA
jgi:hypothetical protein